MNIGKACAIFKDIFSKTYTMEEKATAIYDVLKMPTHNSINKLEMITVIRFLLGYVAQIPPGSPYVDGDKSILSCPECGSGEYLHNEDGALNDFCGQCGCAIKWDAPEGE